MAQSYRDLWPQVVAWSNLVEAYRRCRRRKRSKPEAAAFEFAWESELLKLQRELIDGSYAAGWHCFTARLMMGVPLLRSPRRSSEKGSRFRTGTAWPKAAKQWHVYSA